MVDSISSRKLIYYSVYVFNVFALNDLSDEIYFGSYKKIIFTNRLHCLLDSAVLTLFTPCVAEVESEVTRAGDNSSKNSETKL